VTAGPGKAAKTALLALALVALCVVAVGVAGAADGGEPTTVLVSRADGDGKGGDGASTDPSISADGRYVAFASTAKNLRPVAPSGKSQVYVRDMKTGAVTLVSRADGPGGAPAAAAGSPSISADGRYVAFGSSAALAGGGSDVTAIYVRDLVAGSTTLVSRTNGADGAIANGYSSAPSISADGRHVAFESTADNLSPGDLDEEGLSTDVFVRDLDAGATELVSGPSGSGGGAVTEGREASISADGRYVAFTSRAQLSADDVDEEGFPNDVFVRDRATATTTLASRADGPTGAASNVESSSPSISADGQRVAFASDGKLSGQRSYDRNVFLRDLAAGTTVLVSVGDEGRAGDAKRNPSISADGRYVAFESRGNKISSADADGRVDVFVRDMTTGVTVTVSRASGTMGVPGDAPSSHGSISADGSYVAFDSRAANFSAADADRFADVFLRHAVYAKEAELPRCSGRIATLIGTPGRDVIKGTKRKDVVVALGGDDQVSTGSRADVICAGPGRDQVFAGDNGEGGGSDLVRGGPGADKIVLGPELGRAFGEGGNDTLIGSKGGDNLFGGPGDDLIRGGPNPYFNTDFLYGGPGDDRIYGGPSDNEIKGGPGDDLEVGDRE
jgi:Tol biopolymer transport system component